MVSGCFYKVYLLQAYKTCYFTVEYFILKSMLQELIVLVSVSSLNQFKKSILISGVLCGSTIIFSRKTTFILCMPRWQGLFISPVLSNRLLILCNNNKNVFVLSLQSNILVYCLMCTMTCDDMNKKVWYFTNMSMNYVMLM